MAFTGSTNSVQGKTEECEFLPGYLCLHCLIRLVFLIGESNTISGLGFPIFIAHLLCINC
jgi:hypothetical protein